MYNRIWFNSLLGVDIPKGYSLRIHILYADAPNKEMFNANTCRVSKKRLL